MKVADMQDQLVCHGCRNLLMYPRGASNVRCALCNTINMVPPPPPPHGIDFFVEFELRMRTMLMYTRGASSVRCSCCQTTNLVPAHSNQVAHAPSSQVAQINCGHCRTTLMYPYGASSVKCAVCQFVTNVNMSNGRVPLPTNRPNGTACPPSTSTSTPPSQTQTVVVENPMSVDESGKLVSNVVVGVTTDKK
ncbi:unnamed protein product [Arabidopsis thaliana]|uniref:Zinc finger LSD1-type domain-containing protein n=1 Tax=Arabidopsis thaliana TaxID=3702 RepID=A0A5S9XUN5_ARATH|nr:unnamed protein product [Arabidopsis thaliana]